MRLDTLGKDVLTFFPVHNGKSGWLDLALGRYLRAIKPHQPSVLVE